VLRNFILHEDSLMGYLFAFLFVALHFTIYLKENTTAI
jgi:hypothetical protein